MPELTVLGLNHNEVSDLTAFTGLDKLEVLSVYRNNLVDFNGIQNLPSLKVVEAAENHITHFPDLSSLKHLEIIQAQHSVLTNLHGLENSTIQRLYLCDNKLVDISAIATMKNLWLLDVSKNKLLDLTPL